jgi:hypothetical protein
VFLEHYRMREFKMTGGAKIGMLKSTWPFADLTVTRDKLELNVSLLNKLVFLPGDIKAITPHSGGYKMGAGIKIHHTIPQYKEEVLFWSSKSPAELMRQIEATGFMTNTNTVSQRSKAEVRELQEHGGFAMRIQAVTVVAILWFAIVIYGAINMSLTGSMEAFFSALQVAFGVIILFSIATLVLPAFAKSVLKPGYTAADVNKFLIFLSIIAGFMLVGLSVSRSVV